MVSVIVPISYLVFLFGSLAIFSRYYRRKQNNKEAAEPWFPQHKSRDIYVSLLSLEPPPPRPILVAALLRRAMDDVRLIWSVRDSKQALQTLLQKGQIGDELWERFLAAEKELEAEIVEVVGEANTFQEGYGQQIFGIASEMVSHERWKEIYAKIPEKRAEEKARMESSVPQSLALSPASYLSPTSLSLALSNPLGEASTADNAVAPTTPVILAPLAASSTTSAPPSKEPTKPATVAPAAAPVSVPSTPPNGKAAESSQKTSDNDEDDEVEVAAAAQTETNTGTSTPNSASPSPNQSKPVSATGTPTGSAKKRKPAKKKVKGGK